MLTALRWSTFAISLQRMSLRQSCFIVFLVSLFVIAVMKWGQWRELPYWDAAFSVFPAAITLAQTGFDYLSLLSAPAYLAGGPNVHASSSITLMTAIVLMIFGESSDAYFVLHWIHYSIAALTVALLYSWSSPLVGRPLGIMVAVATLLCPPFLTQAGHMYLELPMACAALLALLAFQNRRIAQASGWALLAVSIKEPGLIVAGALAILVGFEDSPLRLRLKNVAIVIAPSVVFALGQLMLHNSGSGIKVSFMEFVHGALYYLTSAPDVLVIVTLSVLAVSYHSLRIMFASKAVQESAVDFCLRSTIVIVVMFFAFYLTLASLGWIFVLLRYFVLALPFMLLLGCDLSRRALGSRATVLVLVIYCMTSLVNHNGRLYQFVSGNNGAIAERSNEYVDLLRVHQESMAAAERLSPYVPIFHGLPEHYFSQYPGMGYVHSPLKNAHCIMHEPRYSTADLGEFPDHFFLLYSIVSLGGDQLNWLKTQAMASQGYSVSVSLFRQGYYQAQLVEVRRAKIQSEVTSINSR